MSISDYARQIIQTEIVVSSRLKLIAKEESSAKKAPSTSVKIEVTVKKQTSTNQQLSKSLCLLLFVEYCSSTYMDFAAIFSTKPKG